MKTDLEQSIADWEKAGLITPEAAAGIRSFESERIQSASTDWPVILAMVFGGLMLGAGILLFISANWDLLSPGVRFTLVVIAIGLLHGLAAISRAQSETLAVTLHAVGTVAVGGGIAICGQIFHISSHWSNATGLWAAAALGGWFLLREWPQFALAAILVPAFVDAKLQDLFTVPQLTPMGYMGGFAVVIAVAYLGLQTSRLTHHELRALRWIGGVALLPSLLWMRGGSGNANHAWEQVGFAFAAMALISLVTREIAWEHLLVAVWCAVPLNARLDSLATHLHLFIGGAGLAAWGVAKAGKLLINWGVTVAGIAIVLFFFSSVFDKLGRSLGLIAAGIVLIVGGFLLEQLRRGLVGQMERGE